MKQEEKLMEEGYREMAEENLKLAEMAFETQREVVMRMTKQEEIREGLISKVKSIRLWATNTDDPLSPEDDAIDILKCLDSQGGVLRVECPDCVWSQFKDETTGMTPCYHCNSTGYIIETLI